MKVIEETKIVHDGKLKTDIGCIEDQSKLVWDAGLDRPGSLIWHFPVDLFSGQRPLVASESIPFHVNVQGVASEINKSENSAVSSNIFSGRLYNMKQNTGEVQNIEFQYFDILEELQAAHFDLEFKNKNFSELVEYIVRISIGESRFASICFEHHGEPVLIESCVLEKNESMLEFLQNVSRSYGLTFYSVVDSEGRSKVCTESLDFQNEKHSTITDIELESADSLILETNFNETVDEIVVQDHYGRKRVSDSTGVSALGASCSLSSEVNRRKASKKTFHSFTSVDLSKKSLDSQLKRRHVGMQFGSSKVSWISQKWLPIGCWVKLPNDQRSVINFGSDNKCFIISDRLSVYSPESSTWRHSYLAKGS